MNADRLLALYDRVAEAPDAVTRLRRFVLDLAVRGKLVEQNPNDIPTTSILANRNIPVSNSKSFDIPPSWAWVDVGAVAKTRLGKMLDKAKNRGTPRRYLRNINVRWFDFDLSDVLEMRFEDTELAEFSLRAGDVLICEGGEPGRAAVWDEREHEIYFQKAIHRVRFSDIVDSHYFVSTLRASAGDGRLAEHFTGTGIKHFTGKGLRAYAFPLPALSEQHRIVAKINEMMVLCDRLEKARTVREKTRNQVAQTSLARLSAIDMDAATFRSNARFAIDNLPALTAHADQATSLRHTILDLAVRGKLVGQNPGDEPAAELLERVALEKTRLWKTGKIRKPRTVLPLSPNELPFRLAVGWQWTQIAHLGVINPRNEAPDDHEASFVPMRAIAAEYGVSNEHEPRLWGHIRKGYTHFAEGDVGLAKITPCFENGKSTVFRNLTGGFGSGTT
ncbi:MAG: restriction endonuclease subunit S, partial [Chloroflexi bacterium]|nr:restriction endonuclease subunit S [Chloroflexota bacterium]